MIVRALPTFLDFITMAVAGHDTTAAAMAGGCEALAGRPADWARLRRDPALLRHTADEMIRWVTPIKHFMCTATRDCMLGGQAIGKGDGLALYYLSGNFDHAEFEAPFEFRIDRHPNRQIAFGFGPHVCLGMHVARAEMATGVGALLDRLPNLRLDPDADPPVFPPGMRRAKK